MGRRKAIYEYTGEGYPEYTLILKAVTDELEKLYQRIWCRRKESSSMRVICKQVKTAWMLFKTATESSYSVDVKDGCTDQHDYWNANRRLCYVNSRNYQRFDAVEYISHEDDDWCSQSYENWLNDLRKYKSAMLMFPYLCRTMPFWKDSTSFYYGGIVRVMNKQMLELRDYLKYADTWTVTTESVADLDHALQLLKAVQEHQGKDDEIECWHTLFDLIIRRYRWWYD